MKARLGILGGTFDPIHMGHIRLAQAVAAAMKLDRVLFIPAYVPPHKQGLSFAAPEHRYNMTRLAINGMEHFYLSDIELKRTGVSYTVDTIKELRRTYPEHELYFVIGADTVPQLYTWHNIEELLGLVIFVAAGRPGYKDVMAQAEEKLGPIVRERIILLDTPEYNISSTEIRRRVRTGESLSDLLPEEVERYIIKHKLYLND